ncbi:unnamed protein product [Mytilus coruscus]|uniref:Uncharacterized protein n=1 Tax=Mytilus coruscus TaxID=42192 RepID=A0A6J8BZM7_MYTCO|nr:unnamed protein product [Mytilus coruscus]
MTTVRYFQVVKQLKKIEIAYGKKETRLIILRGTHGAGKTQAAFKFCWNCQTKCTIIAKLTATTKDSLIDSMKRLAIRLSLRFPAESSDTGVNVIQSMALLLGEYFNHKHRSKFSYLMLIDDVRLNNFSTDSLYDFISILFEKVKRIKFIITTTENDLFRDFSEEMQQDIYFDGMSRNEYMPFLRRTDIFKKESDNNIDRLVQTVGALPLTLNSARKFMGTLNMSIECYLKGMAELESTPEKYTNAIGESAIPPILISLKKIINDIKKENEDIMEVIMCLRYFDFKAVWPDILEVCCRHFAGNKYSPKIAAVTIVNNFLKYSLCHFVKRSNKTMLSFHAETMLALKLCDKQENQKSECERLWFLIQVFCFEIDIDVRIDISLDRNMLFLIHARKVIRELEKNEDIDNVADEDKVKQRRVYLCYLHYVIGKTILFQATDIPLAHEHLMRARFLCLDLVKYSSDLAENRCPYLEGTEDIPDMQSNNLKEAFKSLCATQMGNTFAEAFVCSKYRNFRDVQILRKASENQNVCKSGYLSKADYLHLSKNHSLALSLDLISEGFLSELMLHILFDNGRALDELMYVANDKGHVKKGMDFEFKTCIEFSDLMKLGDKFKEYPLLRYLAQDRGEQSYKLEKEYKRPSTESLKRRISDMREVKGNSQKNYFQFGILKTSANAHDYYNCQCYRLLLKYHQQLYKLSDSNETLSEGRKDEEEFQKILIKMEHDKKPYKWMEMPKFYIQCAQFLHLSKKTEDYEMSLEFFQKAIDFEENRGVYLTRCLWEGYFGKTKCLLLLKRKVEAKQISDQLRKRLEGTNQTNRIKTLDELFD